MALKNFTQFTPQTLLSATDFMVGYRQLDEIRTDLDSMSLGVSALLISKGFLPGTSVGRIKRVGFVYTIGSSSNLNAVSGTDDNGLTLSYTPDQIEVYRNGSHLANNLDFIATNSTQVTNLSTLNLGDVVEVVALSGVGATILIALSSNINSLVQKNYRYSVASGNTIAPAATLISGSDDYNSVLNFNTNSFQVYLNGSHLVRDYDYISYNSGTAFTLASPVADGDFVDVISLSSVSITSLSSLSAFSGISKILAGDRTAISSSTGNVTVSSQTCISDILVPSWTNAQHISQFSLLQNYLSAVAASNTSPASAIFLETVSLGGSSPNNVGGCLAPNGKIYFAPSSPTYVFDPVTNTVSNIGNITAGGNNYSSVLATNGFIYTGPTNSSFVQKINPANNTSTSFSSTYLGGGSRTFGITLGPNGKIYCAPCTNVTQVLVIDPLNNDYVTTLSTPTLIAGNARYVGAITAPNGKVYFIPYEASSVMVVDPANNDSIATFAFGKNGVNSFYGAALGSNGKIYCPPNGETYCLVIDPNTNTCSSIVAGVGSGNFNNVNTPFLAPNGKIYSFDGGTLYHVIDPSNDTATKNLTFAGAAGYIGQAIVHPSGKVILCPYTGTSVVVVNFINTNNWNINVATNPFFNRF